MKKILPKSINNPQGFTFRRKANDSRSEGFTLVELLVAITIIGILAVIGITVFTGVSRRGNDSRRSSDLDSIAKALEVNKQSGGYQPLQDSQFASGSIPVEPIPTRTQKYCITYTTAANPTIPANPTTWGGGICPTSNSFAAPGVAFTTLANNSTPVLNTTAWKICALLENNITIVCQNSTQ